MIRIKQYIYNFTTKNIVDKLVNIRLLCDIANEF